VEYVHITDVLEVERACVVFLLVIACLSSTHFQLAPNLSSKYILGHLIVQENVKKNLFRWQLLMTIHTQFCARNTVRFGTHGTAVVLLLLLLPLHHHYKFVLLLLLLMASLLLLLSE